MEKEKLVSTATDATEGEKLPRKVVKWTEPEHKAGLRTTDNRIVIEIGDKGKETESVVTEPIPENCECEGCKEYRLSKKKLASQGEEKLARDLK